MTDAGIFFYLACGGRQRGVLLSTAALHQLAGRLGYIMGHMDLYRAHEALIHATARAVASDGDDATLYLAAAHFALTRQLDTEGRQPHAVPP